MPIYEAALQGAFLALDHEVQRAHLPPLVAVGCVDVEHGSHWTATPLVKLLKLPASGRGQPVHLQVTLDGDTLVWTRIIGSVTLETRQQAMASSIEERTGLGRIVFRLKVEDGALLYRQTSLSIGGIRLPRGIAPHVAACVSAATGGWYVEVRVTWRSHLVCRYAGRMAVA